MFYSLLLLLLLPVYACYNLLQRFRSARAGGRTSGGGRDAGGASDASRVSAAGPAGAGRGAAAAADGHDLWVHSASYGEAALALTLARELLAASPGLSIVFTTNTSAGFIHLRGSAKQLAAQYPDGSCSVRYAPYDLPFFINRFLRQTRPRALVLMEAELWRNWCRACTKQGLPIILANARLSDSSLQRSRSFRFVLPPAECLPGTIAAQSPADVENFRRLYKLLGVRQPPRINTCGNIKFDAIQQSHIYKYNSESPAAEQTPEAGSRQPVGQTQVAGRTQPAAGQMPPPEPSPVVKVLRQQLPALPVKLWCGGSTHHPEEQQLLDARLGLTTPNLLILAPRHPRRFNQVAAMLKQRQARGELSFIRASQLAAAAAPSGGALPPEFTPSPPPNPPPTADKLSGAPSAPTLHNKQVLLLDTLGDLAAIYPLVSFAFIGGSFTKRGGQNILEPLACGAPVILGPQYRNLASVLDCFSTAATDRSITLVKDTQELQHTIAAYINTDTSDYAAAAPGIIAANQGAAAATTKLILHLLKNSV